MLFLGKVVQKRWKNIRACFSRELREQKSTKSGQADKKRRTYRYYEKLLFLLPSMETRDGTGNSIPNADKDDEDKSEEEDEASGINKPERKKKKGEGKKSYEDRLIDILEQKRASDVKLVAALEKKNEPDSNDSEKCFALSLVPLLKAVPEKDKINVQIKILQIFNDVQNQQTRCQTSHYSQHLQGRQVLRPIINQPSTSLNYSGSSYQRNYAQVNSKHHMITRPNSSLSLPSSSPRPQQQYDQHSVSLPSPSPQTPPYIILSSPEVSLSSPQNANAPSPVYSESIQSLVSNFTYESGDSEEIYDICNEYGINQTK